MAAKAATAVKPSETPKAEAPKAEKPKTIAGHDPKTRIEFGTFVKKVEKTVDGKKVTEEVEHTYDVRDNNPKKRKAGERFALYRKGMTLEAAVAAGITAADIRWDLDHKFIRVVA